MSLLSKVDCSTGKRNILFVIHGLTCGGAEKSLISLLNSDSFMDWNVDLLVANPNGEFMNSIPSYVNIINDNYLVENYATELRLRRKKVVNLYDFILQSKWQFAKRFFWIDKKLSSSEKKWNCWGKYLPKMEKKYDLAVSYMNGFPNYYVIDKVDAKAKIIWVHNEFEKLGYNIEFEKKYFNKADATVTISKSCADNIIKYYPEIEQRVVVLENISSGRIIHELANKKENDDFFNCDSYRILSVGRLMHQKGFDWAIEAAKILKENNIDFKWYILGEGELRDSFQRKIEDYELRDYFILAGVKSNPYSYMKYCDLFVQCSRYEGKSIALDEAKILAKPILITNYKTGVNSIINEYNGLVVDMTPMAIASGIMRFFNDQSLAPRFAENLSACKAGNDSEIEKYLALFNKLLE